MKHNTILVTMSVIHCVLSVHSVGDPNELSPVFDALRAGANPYPSTVTLLLSN